jgi:hypothetical protein
MSNVSHRVSNVSNRVSDVSNRVSNVSHGCGGRWCTTPWRSPTCAPRTTQCARRSVTSTLNPEPPEP